MPNRLFLLILLFFIVTCSMDKDVTIKGDLYFQMIDFFNYYDLPDTVITKIENNVNHIHLDTLSINDRKVYEMIKYALNQDILRKPYIRIKTKKGENIMLYMDSINYVQFDSLKCFHLREQGKKIHIVANAYDISFQDFKVFKLKEFKRVERIIGKTECKK